jgi:glycosyltransferase involved in cell wall biosynthesis
MRLDSMAKNDVRFVVIVPAYNEEEFLFRTLNGLTEQTLQLTRVVIVDDMSDDDTYAIAEEFEKFSDIFKVVKKTTSVYSKHWSLQGNRIAESFNFGVDYLPEKWDFLAKIDADMVLNPDFFELIYDAFTSNERLGISGGIVEQQIYANVIVRGGCRVYKKECWMEITDIPKKRYANDVPFRKGYAPPLGGWDTFLANKSKMLTWENMVVAGARANMLREVGGKTLKSRLITSIRRGNNSRRNGYWSIFFIGRVFRNLLRSPFLLNGILMAFGWFWSWWNRLDHYDEEVAEWLNETQKRIARKYLS